MEFLEGLVQFAIILSTFWCFYNLSKRGETNPVDSTSKIELPGPNKKKKRRKPKKKSVPEPSEVKVKQEEEVESSDSDDDYLTAAQVLEKRKFQPKTIGGMRRNSDIKKTTNTGITFLLDQKVMARYQKGQEWFPGTITKVSRGQIYTVEYDDGEIETKLESKYIRSAGTTAQALSIALEEEQNEDTWDLDASKPVDDGWEVVASKSQKEKDPNAPRYDPDTGEEILTKKQREARRQAQRRKEKKQEMRSAVQDRGLHARWGGSLNPAKKS